MHPEGETECASPARQSLLLSTCNLAKEITKMVPSENACKAIPVICLFLCLCLADVCCSPVTPQPTATSRNDPCVMQGTDAVMVVNPVADVFMFGVLTLYFSAKFNNDCWY